MANQFLQVVKRAILRHGQNCTYVRVTRSAFDPETNKVTETLSNTSIRMYRRHMNTSQFNFPHLIGKETIMFYAAADSFSVKPAIKDRITVGSINYVIDSIQETVAHGETVLYRMVAVKS